MDRVNFFSFSDRQMEDAFYEIERTRRLAGFGSVTEALPDETTMLQSGVFLKKAAYPANKAEMRFVQRFSRFKLES